MVIPKYPRGTKYLKMITMIIETLNHPNLRYLCIMKKIIPLEEGDFYYTPEGYRCFTEQYLLKRGYCCESGCRHCPYGFDKSALKKK